jgi:outer membrane protein OmpA-like peptidoglycan-associated protein
MAVNLIELITKEFSGDIVGKIGSFLGEDTSKITKGVGGAVPSILSGLLSKGSTESGASEILNLIKGGNFGESALKNIGNALSGGGATNDLIKSGASILSTLFGDKLGGIENLIASVSGLAKGSASSLLGMVVPFVMSILGKQVSSSGLNAGGLMSLLGSQKGFIEKLAPAGLANVLGLSSLSNLGGATMGMVDKAAKRGSSFLKWLILIILAAIILFFLLRNCNNKTVESVTGAIDSTTAKVTDVVSETATKVTDALASLGAFADYSLPNGVKLNIPEFGIERKLIAFIEDESKPVDKTTWFTFDRLAFETGSTKLKASSQEQLKNIAEILKAYPNVNLKIGGYTDNTGSAQTNLKLSQERADNTMAELVKLGVDKSRLAAEGYGEQHPVADNSTEEGRQKNRRIDLRVTQK